jgi:hypothetical protein
MTCPDIQKLQLQFLKSGYPRQTENPLDDKKGDFSKNPPKEETALNDVDSCAAYNVS